MKRDKEDERNRPSVAVALVAAAMLALLLLAFLPRLARAAPVEIASQLWELRPDVMPECERVVWVRKEWAELRSVCGALACSGPSAVIPACTVFSGYSESEARAVRVYGESLYAHEARHILERMLHPTSSR